MSAGCGNCGKKVSSYNWSIRAYHFYLEKGEIA